jgi:hypothetical protein
MNIQKFTAQDAEKIKNSVSGDIIVSVIDGPVGNVDGSTISVLTRKCQTSDPISELIQEMNVHLLTYSKIKLALYVKIIDGERILIRYGMKVFDDK